MFFYRTKQKDVRITWEHLYNKRGFSFYRFYLKDLGTWHFSHLKLVETKANKKQKFYVTTEAETGTLTVEVSQGSDATFYFVLKDCFGYSHQRIKMRIPKKCKEIVSDTTSIREAS